MKEKVHIGMVGLGDHALQSHLKHLINIPEVIVVGAFDPAPEAHANAAAYTTELKKYDEFEDMTNDPVIDAILISSPDRYHLTQLEGAVKNGKHAFCEKPLCGNESELERLKAVLIEARTDGLIVTSCHPRRFDPPYVWLKNNLGELSERFGKPTRLGLDFTYHKPSDDKRHLHGDSMLQDHMNHEIDYLHSLFGHSNFKATKLLDEHDRYELSGVRKDGIVFNFGGTRRLNSRSYAESVTLRFERGTVHIDTYNPKGSYIYDHENYKPDQPYEPILGLSPTDYDERFMKINQNWVDTIRGKAENYLTNEDMIVNSVASVAFQKRSQLKYKF